MKCVRFALAHFAGYASLRVTSLDQDLTLTLQRNCVKSALSSYRKNDRMPNSTLL